MKVSPSPRQALVGVDTHPDDVGELAEAYGFQRGDLHRMPQASGWAKRAKASAVGVVPAPACCGRRKWPSTTLAGSAKAILYPGNVFEDRRGRVPVGQVDMDLAHLAGMRHDREPVRISEVGDLDVFRDPGKPRHIRLHEAQRAGREKGLEGVERIELLAERDWNRGRPCQRGVARDVVIPERLLEPEDVERLGPRAEAQAGRQVPFSVAVDGDAHGRADRPTHGGEPVDIRRRIVMADLELDAGEAVDLDGTLGPGDQFVLGEACSSG
jgi:hypothetical protein